MIAIDWSHNKGLTIYDGKKASVVDRKALLKKLAGESKCTIKSLHTFNPASSGAGSESTYSLKSIEKVKLSVPLIILEQGCPLSLIHDILKTGCGVKTISNRATQDYRVERNIEKSDENDAKIIYDLSNNGARLTPVSLEDSQIQLVDLYQRYKRYQKARVAMMNMRKAYIRQFGNGGESIRIIKSSRVLNLPSLTDRDAGESNLALQSNKRFNPSPAIKGEEESKRVIKSMTAFNSSLHDGVLPYDIAIDTLKAAENECLTKIVKLTPDIPVRIRGLGKRLWAGIFVTANPTNFPTLSSYLRFCGLVNREQLGTKWNRHASMLYHLLAEEVMKQKDGKFRPIYDKSKADITERYPDYTKLHIHNAALNRTATFLAKEIYKEVKNA